MAHKIYFHFDRLTFHYNISGQVQYEEKLSEFQEITLQPLKERSSCCFITTFITIKQCMCW